MEAPFVPSVFGRTAAFRYPLFQRGINRRELGVGLWCGDPIENLRRRHRLLRRIGIQGHSNRGPDIVNHILGKLPGLRP